MVINNCVLCKDSFDLWDEDAKRLLLHIIGMQAIDLLFYGHAKMVRTKTCICVTLMGSFLSGMAIMPLKSYKIEFWNSKSL